MTKWERILLHRDQAIKQRIALKCGGTPWQLIKRPKGMDTRDFKRRIRLLKYHQEQFVEKSAYQLLKDMKITD